LIIKVERSGGLTGIAISKEIDVKDLPSTLVNTAKKMMVDEKFPKPPMKAPPRGSADYFSYKISVQNGVNRKIIECNEHNIQDDLKQLVKYIERSSGKEK
jgi:emfourin